MPMLDPRKRELWFLTGSQHLYGDETLKQVADDSRKIAEFLDRSGKLPVRVVWKPTLTGPEDILNTCVEANGAADSGVLAAGDAAADGAVDAGAAVGRAEVGDAAAVPSGVPMVATARAVVAPALCDGAVSAEEPPQAPTNKAHTQVHARARIW